MIREQPRWDVADMADGSRLVAIPVDGSETFYVQMTVALGGRHCAGSDDFEMAHFLEHLFAPLTSSRHPSAEKNEGEFADRGIRLNALTYDTRTRFYYRGQGDRNLRFVIGLLLDAYNDFRIDMGVMEKEKQAVVNELNQYLSDPSYVMNEALDGHLYRDFPISSYTMKQAKKSCLRLTPESLMDAWRRYYRGKTVIFTVCGRFGSIRHLFDRRIRHHDSSSTPMFRTPVFSNDGADVVLRNRLEASETNHVRILWHTKGIPYLSLEYHSLNLIDHVLISTFASRLMKRLRTDLGMIYGIDSMRMTDDNGHTVYGFMTSVYKKGYVRRVIREIRSQCDRLTRTPISADEVRSVRNQASMSFMRENETRLDPYFWVKEYSENIRIGIPIIPRSDLIRHYTTVSPRYIQDLAKKAFGGSVITQIALCK